MRKTIFMMLLAVVSGSAVAGWVEVGTSDVSILYADLPTMRKTGNVVTLWYLLDFTTRQEYAGGATYVSAKTNAEFDCANREWRQLSFSWHSGNMGEGDVVLSASETEAWHAVPRRSGSEVLWNLSCVTEPSVVDFSKKR
jgi:hypothetical protein